MDIEKFLQNVQKLGNDLVVKDKDEIINTLSNLEISLPECFETPDEFFGFLLLREAALSIPEIIRKYWILILYYDDSIFDEFIREGKKTGIGEKFRVFLESFRDCGILHKSMVTNSGEYEWKLSE